MIKLTTNVLGVFAVKNDSTIDRELFPKDTAEIAKRLSAAVEGVCEEEEKLIKRLIKTGVKELYVENPSRFWGNKLEIKFIEDKEPVDPSSIGSQLGIPRDETLDLIAEVNRILTFNKLKDVESDSTILQAIGALDELEDSANTLVERLREWYSLHFPELDQIIQKHEIYARFVANIGDRNGFSDAKLGVDTEFANKIKAASKDSLGAEFNKRDVEAIQSLAAAVVSLTNTKNGIEAYIEASMKEIAPNTAELVGGLLGARLIAKAGSLRKLALMPASTIQVLGAEDAFFRFLKTRKKPPKHGIIFQHPDVRSAPNETRGKISRSLAAKIAIAARIDAFKGGFIGDKLKEDFKKRVASLK